MSQQEFQEDPISQDHHHHHASRGSGSPQEKVGKPGLAISSMVLGIVGIASCWIPFWGFTCSVTAIVFGRVVLNADKVNPDPDKSKANAGLIMGILGLIPGSLFIFIFYWNNILS